MNRILQSAARGESLIICDPKSELYEKSSEYMRDLGYTVRVFNLVSPENSDSWNCLKEIEGQELMAQLFVDVIIKNTNGTGKSDRFWDSGEIYHFRSPEIEAGESMLAANGISFFPYPSRYAVRYEGESPYTAMDFARQIKKRPLAELLSMQLLPYEILEVDDGIRPYCFLVERLGHVRCIRFKSDIARESKYEESGGKAI